MVGLLVFCKIDVNCQLQANGKQMLSRKKTPGAHSVQHRASRCSATSAGSGHPPSPRRKEKHSALPCLLLIQEFLSPGTRRPSSKMFSFI